MMKEYNLMINSVAFFISIANSNDIYHVVPDDDYDASNNTHTLKYYVSNYNFTSNPELLFKQGQYYLTTAMLEGNVQNFTMRGNKICRITCAESVWIMVFNVTNFKLENMDFQFKSYPNNSRYPRFRFTDLLHYNTTCNASIVLYQCTSVVINKLEVNNNDGIAGIAAVNIIGSSIISQVSLIVKINCTMCPQYLAQINGIVVNYKEWVGKMPYHFKQPQNILTIRNSLYKLQGSCPNSFQYAINLTFSQKHYNASRIHNELLIEPSSSRVITGSVKIVRCNFCKNTDIKVETK